MRVAATLLHPSEDAHVDAMRVLVILMLLARVTWADPTPTAIPPVPTTSITQKRPRNLNEYQFFVRRTPIPDTLTYGIDWVGDCEVVPMTIEGRDRNRVRCYDPPRGP